MAKPISQIIAELPDLDVLDDEAQLKAVNLMIFKITTGAVKYSKPGLNVERPSLEKLYQLKKDLEKRIKEAARSGGFNTFRGGREHC